MPQLKNNPKKEYMNLNDRMIWSDVPYNNTSICGQRVRDKIGRSNNWQVLTSNYDDKLKKFMFVIMINAKDTDLKVMTDKDVCSFLGWKSYKYDKATDTFTPKRISSASF